MIKGNGIVYNNKHSSNLGKTIGMRFNTLGKNITPGPGHMNFSVFSEDFINMEKNKFNYSKINKDKKSSAESKKVSKVDLTE